MEVTLDQILDAREARAQRQLQLNRKYAAPVLSFTMNIPGPVKDTPLIRRAFQEGLTALDACIPSGAVLEQEILRSVTGCEAAFALNLDAADLKRITTCIEDEHPLGRLFDMDVLDIDLNKLDREPYGGKSRDCIVCGAPGRDCASRRLHSVPALQKAVHGILVNHFKTTADFHTIGTWAALSLLDEVSITPKPGLVDRRNSGSHRDMNFATFMESTASLVPYFRRCVRLGWETRRQPPGDTFPLLRQAGIEAEQAMFRVTGGINTHKGAIFTLGILCGAAGRLWTDKGSFDADTLFQVVSEMVKTAVAEDFRTINHSTTGGRLFLDHGIMGIRGEAAAGYPSIRQIGLPVFRRCLSEGQNYNHAGAIALLHLIAAVEDTNMIARGGFSLAGEARQKASALLPDATAAQLEELDEWFISRNLSPGGCADLMAAVCFVHRLIAH